MKVLVTMLGMMMVMTVTAGDSQAFGSRRSSGGSAPAPAPVPTATPIVVNPPSDGDHGTGGLKVALRQTNNFGSSGLELLESARAILEKVVNTEEFKQRVIHFTYGGQETYVQNNGLTNLQIYNMIMAGAEQFPKATPANNTMDLYTELYTSSWFGRNVVGYTDPSTSTIFMNTYYFNYAEASGVAGNMMHEWLHKLGFDHDYNSTSRRPYSVPYAIGDIAEEMASKY